MTDPSDAAPRLHEQDPGQNRAPLEALRNSVGERQYELAQLMGAFETALDLLEDVDAINEELAASARPDLVINERATMMAVNELSGLKRVNNFIPNLRTFGVATMVQEEPVSEGGNGWQEFAGYRDPTTEELDFFFTVGARGNMDDYKAFAEQNGIDEKTMYNVQLNMHLSKAAFMRMWILFPDMTNAIMGRCLNRDRSNSWERNSEEIFVAYNIMARLVDTGDAYVIRNGEVDDWALCR